ncbi:hypothetical protein M422DRAFT_191408 [Sphaerobolus stellatus SS14]|uniref:Unplaced genomic scaffold SPHSTscaffold_272, whole genome shotgun sequence n=1 Tax=Sphaerobolus stellatus (strain SS14) TaxID=990650 RepID=A0A0C9TZ34_SPHS4|nr:hypothetical protein M422DRAFT_191408 [Sphaerobolus stellatus SS14]
MIPLQSSLVACTALLLGAYYTRYLPSGRIWDTSTSVDDVERFSCRPFLPALFVDTPPGEDHPLLKSAAKGLDKYLENRFARGDIDSMSIAVLTSKGAIYERNFGVMRGNETDSKPTTSHSTYRLASVAKLFPVLESLILRQKGILTWEDPVDKYIPEFKPRLDGFDPTKPVTPNDKAGITIAQLASHMSGLGRDWPSGTVKNWPQSLEGGGPPPTNGLPFPSHESLFKAIKDTRLVSPPQAYPVYSNTGTGLLGLTIVAANRAAKGNNEPKTYADLVERDIFKPLHMNDTHHLSTEKNKHMVVVPSMAPEIADQDFLDAMNPAAGQFSSLSDMVSFTQTLLNPRHPRSVLTRESLDLWLQPVHSFEEDDWTELGYIWEIVKAADANGRLRKIYMKLGAMGGFQTAVALHPGTGYGVVVLLAGKQPDATEVTYDIFGIYQAAIDGVLAEYSTTLYVGEWKSADGKSNVTISLEKGTLYVESFTLLETNVLQMLFSPGRLALRDTRRRDEFRLDTGFPGHNGQKYISCYAYWNGQDLWGLRNGAPINLIYFSGSETDRTLHVPSVDVVMKRAK